MSGHLGPFHVKRRTERCMSAVSLDEDGVAAGTAERLFGPRLPLATRYVDLLTEQGVLRGLIGPREVPRLWQRHILNSAVVAELIPTGATVVDVGSGAGLPGVPLALARPDLTVTLLEPMARRVGWLQNVVTELGIPVEVVRGRAEEPDVQRRLGGADVVTARAVAPLAKLAGWCLPLVRPGGQLVALKGESAGDELARDADLVRRAGGSELSVVSCGSDVLPVPTTVIVVRRDTARTRDDLRRTRKDR
jgi:16S rRNA (guanine527-N7)-methyltransferase